MSHTFFLPDALKEDRSFGQRVREEDAGGNPDGEAGEKIQGGHE
jgi:hypothetical protein